MLASLERLPSWLRQAVVFAVIGGLGFLLDAGVLTLLTHFGAPPPLARAVSIALTVVFTWQLNHWITFRRRTPPTFSEFGQYVAISLASIVINYGVFTGLVFLHTPLILAAAIGTVVAAVFNFIRYRALLSKDDRPPLESTPAE